MISAEGYLEQKMFRNALRLWIKRNKTIRASTPVTYHAQPEWLRGHEIGSSAETGLVTLHFNKPIMTSYLLFRGKARDGLDINGVGLFPSSVTDNFVESRSACRLSDPEAPTTISG